MKNVYLLLVTLLLTPFILMAQNEGIENDSISSYKKGSWGIGIKGSTIGYGAEINYGISPKLVVRAGWNNFTYTDNLEIEDLSVTADVDIKLGGPTLLLDYYFIKHIHISGGFLFNLMKTEALAVPAEEYTFGEITLSPETVGSIDIAIEPSSKISPYLGIGFGRALSLDKRLAANFELGAFYHGEPKATITATEMLAPTASEEQNSQLNNNLSSYSLYPFLSFMISYKFIK